MSGNRLAAARRLEFALGLLEAGETEAAAEAAVAATEADPAYPEAWFTLGEALQRAGREAAALDAYRRYLHEEPADRMGAVTRLVQLGAAPAPDMLPPAYVQALFDGYAARFDRALRESLAYCGPELIAGALRGSDGGAAHFARALDLGCGTGLVGLALRPQAAWLEGLDLSPGMLARARRSGAYDRLCQEEALAGLQSRVAAGEDYDLVTAGDMLTYVGALGPLFAAVAAVLRPGGAFVALCERQDQTQQALLGPSQRFAHHPAQVLEALVAAGLTVERLNPVVMRLEAGRPVPSLLVAARRD